MVRVPLLDLLRCDVDFFPSFSAPSRLLKLRSTRKRRRDARIVECWILVWPATWPSPVDRNPPAACRVQRNAFCAEFQGRQTASFFGFESADGALPQKASDINTSIELAPPVITARYTANYRPGESGHCGRFLALADALD